MSDSDTRDRSACWYTVWPEKGSPKSFGPYPLKATFFPYPEDEDERDEPDELRRRLG